MARRDPLSDACLVVRGGLMELLPLRISLDTCMARHGFYGLSFFGEDNLTLGEIVAAAGARLEHPQIRTSSIGRIRALGLHPYRSGEYPHLTIRFEISPADDELRALSSGFEPPIPNPGHPR